MRYVTPRNEDRVSKRVTVGKAYPAVFRGDTTAFESQNDIQQIFHGNTRERFWMECDAQGNAI